MYGAFVAALSTRHPDSAEREKDLLYFSGRAYVALFAMYADIAKGHGFIRAENGRTSARL
jgi:hypothetical protein